MERHELLTTKGSCRVTYVGDTKQSPHVLVIGAGISGLSTAWVLLERGYEVTIIAKDWPSLTSDRLTSQISGALWEYPPAVCGHHNVDNMNPQVAKWSMISYHFYHSLARNAATAEEFGIQMRRCAFFFTDPIMPNTPEWEKMQNISSSGVINFQHDGSHIRQEYMIPATYKDGYSLLAPVIDTDKALMHMRSLLRSKGAKEVTKTIRNLNAAEEDRLCRDFKAIAIINATGLGAREVADDDNVYALRGGVQRVYNNNSTDLFRGVEDALVVSATAVPENVTSRFIFIIPRNDRTIILGGFSEPQSEQESFSAETMAEEMKKVRDSCNDFLPTLVHARSDPAYPEAKGSRPARVGDVRVARESKASQVIHNYGHAGSGWSLAFGCALHVAGLVEEICVTSEVLGSPAKANV